MEIYNEFAKWLDKLLDRDLPKTAAAWCFNIYEEADEEGKDTGEYGVQLIAADEFDENDGGDWACSEVWSSEEDLFYIDHSDEKNADSSRGQQFVGGLIREYLKNGSMKDKLLSLKAVAAGFVDGDLEIICKA